MSDNQRWFAYFLCPNCKKLVKYWCESYVGTCYYTNKVNADLDTVETFGCKTIDGGFDCSYCPLCRHGFQEGSEYFLIEISRNLEIRVFDPTWNYWTADEERKRLFGSLKNKIIDQHLKILEEKIEEVINV